MSTTSSPNRNEASGGNGRAETTSDVDQQAGNESLVIDENEWLAVKSFNRQASTAQEIFNIVSISIDREKVHNRVRLPSSRFGSWPFSLSVDSFR